LPPPRIHSVGKAQGLSEDSRLLDALSPLKVLSRGYSIAVTETGEILKDFTQVNEGDRFRLTLHSGMLGCRVEEISKEDN
jgi:exodeoxyribonuclease VII large subunit